MFNIKTPYLVGTHFVVRSGVTTLANNKKKAAGVGVDSADSYKLKYNQGGTVVSILDNGGLISGRFTHAVINLGGAAWNTGNGTALYLSWLNPSAASIVIQRLIVVTTTASTGAATMAAGTTATNNHTTADNLIDDYDLQTTAPGIHDNLTGTDTEIKSAVLAAGAWITFKASADPTGLVGNAYIQWFPL